MEHVTEGTWESLPVPLHPRVLGALRELRFPYMTPVQVAARRGGGASVRRGRWAGRAPAGWDTPARAALRPLLCHLSLQSATIPLFLKNKDVAAEAVSAGCGLPSRPPPRGTAGASRPHPPLSPLVPPLQVTGSGKTLAFVIPILEILLRREEKLKRHQVRRTPSWVPPPHPPGAPGRSQVARKLGSCLDSKWE